MPTKLERFYHQDGAQKSRPPIPKFRWDLYMRTRIEALGPIAIASADMDDGRRGVNIKNRATVILFFSMSCIYFLV